MMVIQQLDLSVSLTSTIPYLQSANMESVQELDL